MRKYLRLLCLLCALMISVFSMSTALTAPAVEDRGMDLMIHHLHYPALTGLDSTDSEDRINDAILTAGDVAALTARLAVLISSPIPLDLSYRYSLGENVFSCVLETSGPITGARREFRSAAVNCRLSDASAFRLEDFFTDPAQGRSFLEAYLEENLFPELSPLLMNAQLTPVPEVFLADQEGITLFYPYDQLSTLSDHAGSIQLNWQELLPVLALSEGSLPAAFGADDALQGSAISLERLLTLASQGMLPGLPVQIGDSMTEVIDRYGLLHDPDDYEQGRMFALEDGRFRNAFLLTDGLTSKTWDHSVIQGIRSDRFQAAGIVCGTTARSQWQAILGEPDASVSIDPDRAALMRVSSGISDYYQAGSYRLCLHAGEGDLLESVFLIP